MTVISGKPRNGQGKAGNGDTNHAAVKSRLELAEPAHNPDPGLRQIWWGAVKAQTAQKGRRPMKDYE